MRNPSLSANVIRLMLGLTVWSAGVFGALSVANLPGDWEHGICGPWGCGPPLQALVACHLAWFLVLTPPAIGLVASHRVPLLTCRRIGIVLIVAAVLGTVAVVVIQRMQWLPQASEWQRPYFWQRCGFCIATLVDFPLTETLIAGCVLVLAHRHRKSPAEISTGSHLSHSLHGSTPQ